MQRPGLNSHSQKRTSLNLHTAWVPQPPTIFACLTGTGCAPYAHYALIGVINRLDRVVFKSDSCGELRFLYRLEYEKDKRARDSHDDKCCFYLPGSAQTNWGDCRSIAAQLNDWMNNPLGEMPGVIANASLKSVESNLQVLRAPSSVLPEMGGDAEYLLRVFHMNNQKLERATLENTPDVDRINRDPQLKADLISYLNNQKNMHR